MPLRKPGKSASKSTKRAAASANIRAELRAGRPRKQAIAIALNAAGLSKKKRRSRKK